MKVTVEYAAQLKVAAGVAQEEVEIANDRTLKSLVSRLVDLHGEPLTKLLLSEDGGLHPSILVFVGDRQVGTGEEPLLQDRDVVLFLSPISGG